MIVGISLFGRVIAELTTVVIDEDKEGNSDEINYLIDNMKNLNQLTNDEIDNLIKRINKYKK